MRQLRPSPFVRDLVLTTGTLGLTSVALIVATRWLAAGLGPEAFGAYGLAKRMLGIAVPLTTVTMGVALARRLGAARAEDERQAALLGALLVALAPTSAVALGAWLFAPQVAERLFRDLAYTSLGPALGVALVGQACYAVLYAVYRGRRQMGSANLCQLAVDGAGPLIVAGALAPYGRADWIVLGTGLVYCLTAVPLVRDAVGALVVWRDARRAVAAALAGLLRYGVPRVPGSVAMAGLFAVGPLLAPHFASLEDGGYLVAGQSVFALAESGVAAFGLVILARAAGLYAEGNVEFLRERMQDVMVVGVHVGGYVTVHLLLWADVLVRAWLGEGFAPAVPLMRVLALSLIPYVLYATFRSVIDAVETRAINALNLYVALSATVVVAGAMGVLGLGAAGLAMATAVGFVCLGLLTVRYLREAGWVSLRGLRIPEFLALNAAAALVAGSVRAYVAALLGPAGGLAVALATEAVLFAGYCAVLHRLDVGWIRQLERRLLSAA